MTDLYSNPELIKELFFYRDGSLYWKKKVSTKVNIGQKAGGITGGGRSDKGRFKLRYDKKLYRIHRLIYLMHHNTLPKYIDHIDGDSFNNRIENLREVSLAENAWNTRLSKRNKSGVKGVLWETRRNMWLARCMKHGKYYHVGYFKQLEDAKIAIEKFRAELHGEFARNA